MHTNSKTSVMRTNRKALSSKFNIAVADDGVNLCRQTQVYNEFTELFEETIEKIIKATNPDATGEDLARVLES